MTWEIPIAGWRPHSLNELMKVHHMRAAHMKKLDRDHVILFSRMHHPRIPPPMGKRRIGLRITLPKGQRRWDCDALWKSLLDGCKHAGLIVDDNPKWCEIGGVEYIRGKDLSTTIIVEETTLDDSGDPTDE